MNTVIKSENKTLFPVGRIVIIGAKRDLKVKQLIFEFLTKHQCRDEFLRKMVKELSVKNGYRILHAYKTNKEERSG